MNFKSIPENGSSWLEPLRYSFTLSGGVQRSVEVKIRDVVNGRSVGQLILYDVDGGEVDVSPYVRSYMAEPLPVSTVGLSPSQTACRIVVSVNGVESEPRTLFRKTIDYSQPMVLSGGTTNRVVMHGEMIRLSLYAPTSVIVRLSFYGVALFNRTFKQMTDGMPLEFAFDTSTLDKRVTKISVEVVLDGDVVKTFNYEHAAESSSMYHMVWFNDAGGVEDYTFPYGKRLSYSSVVSGKSVGGGSHVVENTMHVRLFSAVEVDEELERIIGIIRSPRLYYFQSKSALPVGLATRSVGFDEHGTIKRLSIDVELAWKGGVQ